MGIDLPALRNCKVAVNVSGRDAADADETYTMAAESDTDSGFGSAVQGGSLTVTAPGLHEIPLSRDFVAHLDAATG